MVGVSVLVKLLVADEPIALADIIVTLEMTAWDEVLELIDLCVPASTLLQILALVLVAVRTTVSVAVAMEADHVRDALNEETVVASVGSVVEVDSGVRSYPADA